MRPPHAENLSPENHAPRALACEAGACLPGARDKCPSRPLWDLTGCSGGLTGCSGAPREPAWGQRAQGGGAVQGAWVTEGRAGGLAGTLLAPWDSAHVPRQPSQGSLSVHLVDRALAQTGGAEAVSWGHLCRRNEGPKSIDLSTWASSPRSQGPGTESTGHQPHLAQGCGAISLGQGLPGGGRAVYRGDRGGDMQGQWLSPAPSERQGSPTLFLNS